MKTILLKDLTFKNFKGIKDLVVDFGDITNVLAENGKGKTTIFDGYTWLLFDKDSLDRVAGDKEANFQIKPLDENSEPIHGLDSTVTGTLIVNGKATVLSKTFREKWTKRKGEAAKVFTGHETIYYVDDVPVKKSEYQKKINDLIEEGIFKLLSNPMYFNNNLKWQDRRTIMLNIVGDVSIDNVINYNPELKALIPALEERDIGTLKASLAARKKKLNDDIKKIPVRIDEVNNSIKEYDFTELQEELINNQAILKTIEDQLLDNSKIYDSAAKEKEKLYGLKSKIRDMEYKADSEKNKPLDVLKNKFNNIKFKIKDKDYELKNVLLKKTNSLEAIDRLNKEIVELRANWHEVDKETLIFKDDEFVCPTCNRPFEEHDIENKKEHMLSNFNQNKSKRLSDIGAKGKTKSAELNKLQEGLKDINSNIENLQQEIEALNTEKVTLETSIENFKPEDILSSNEEYINLKKQAENLELELQNPIESAAIDTLKKDKEDTVKVIDDIKAKLAVKERNEESKARITQLMEEEKQLAEQIAKIEGQEFLCENFIKTKVELLESGINNKFKYVNFKLFNTQINGAVEECCEALIKGVPFSNANKAAQYNAGIDIINALSEYYQVTTPIFIDNRESINDIIDCNSQLVNLIVSKDKELKIEKFEREVI